MSIGETVIRKSRKDRVCSEISWHKIKRGDYYLYCAIPPWEHHSGKWRLISACLKCAHNWSLHTSDTRKRIEAIRKQGGGR